MYTTKIFTICSFYLPVLRDFICCSSDDEILQQYDRSYTPVIRSLKSDDFSMLYLLMTFVLWNPIISCSCFIVHCLMQFVNLVMLNKLQRYGRIMFCSFLFDFSIQNFPLPSVLQSYFTSLIMIMAVTWPWLLLRITINQTQAI